MSRLNPSSICTLLYSQLPRALFGATLAALSTAVVNADTLDSIRPSAERLVIKADGVSTTVISAQVYDEHGGSVPDGTRVRFTTTAGRLDASVAPTQSGIARVTLTSADQVGVADVQMILDVAGQSLPTHLQITFSNDVSNVETGAAWIHIDGRYTAYTTNFANVKIVQANGRDGKARVSYRGLVINGDVLQVDLLTNIVTVRGNAKISRDGVTREYRYLIYNLTHGEGNGQRLDDGQLNTYDIKGSKLTESVKGPGPPYIDPLSWSLEDMANGEMTVVATTIAVNPNTSLQFHNATIYGNGYKLKFKNYAMTLDQKTVYSLPLVGYGPSGLIFDVPYVYDLQTSTQGTLNLRHGGQVGTSVYSVRPGWSLDAIQNYTGPQSIDGSFEIDGLGRDDWSAQLHHSQRLDDRTTASVFVQAPSVSDLFLTTQVSRTYKQFQLNLLGSGSRSGSVIDPTTGVRTNTSGEERGQITAQTNPKPLFDIPKVQYVIETGISRQDSYAEAGTAAGVNTTKASTTPVIALRPGLDAISSAANAAATGIVDTQQLSTRFFTPALPIAPRLTLTQSVTVGQNWIEGSASSSNGLPGSGISVLGTTTFVRGFGALGSGNIAYNYAQTPDLLTSGIATAAVNDNAHHRISLGTNIGHGQIWNLTFTGSRGLDIDQSSLFTVLGFGLGGPTRGSLTLNETNAGGVKYNDVEYRLTRLILGHAYSFYYSTTYKEIQFDTSAITF